MNTTPQSKVESTARDLMPLKGLMELMERKSETQLNQVNIHPLPKRISKENVEGSKAKVRKMKKMKKKKSTKRKRNVIELTEEGN